MAGLTKQKSAEYIANNVGGSAPEILIGGRDSATNGLAAPNVNLSWAFGGAEEECFLNINRPGGIAAAGERLDDNMLSLPTGDIFHFDTLGRLKWDIEFQGHPGVYVWEFAVQCSQGISFHYQPPLTLDEIVAGHERPDDVVGSYAVYCDKQNNQYKTGKLLHLYRPHFIDATGDVAWGTLDITDGVMTVEIDQEWMDAAAYPVILDPTMGYDHLGSGAMAASSAYRAILEADMYTAAAGDTITAIHMGLRTYFSGTIPVGIFDASDLSKIGGASPYANSTTSQFCTVSGLFIALDAGQECCMAVGTNSQLQQKYDSYTAACRMGSFGDPWVDSNIYDYRLSMYADIESRAGGGYPIKTNISGAWVDGTLKVRTGGAWLPGQLKRFNGTTWE